MCKLHDEEDELGGVDDLRHMTSSRTHNANGLVLNIEHATCNTLLAGDTGASLSTYQGISMHAQNNSADVVKHPKERMDALVVTNLRNKSMSYKNRCLGRIKFRYP